MTTDKLYTDPRFLVLGLSSFLFFVSFNMIVPELPAYLTSLGGEDYKGMIIGLFAISAGLARPFSGKLTDTIGRLPVLFIGCLVCVVLGFLYPLISSVSGFLLLRFLHGFSTGFKPTADVAYVADIVPANKRGEAMGIMGITNNLGMSVGPALGSEVAFAFGINTLFYVSAIVAFLAVLVLFKLPETLKDKQKFQLQHLGIKKRDLFEPSVKLPALIMLLTVFSFGTMLTLVPDYALHLGLQKQGYFFMALTLTSLMVRLFSGKLSDKKGRRYVMMWGVFFLILAMITMALANNLLVLFIAAALLGISTGFNSPTLFAWAIDLSDDRFKGRGMATLYIALEAGIAIGAFASAAIYNNKSANFFWAFSAGAALAAIAFVILWLNYRKAKPQFTRQ